MSEFLDAGITGSAPGPAARPDVGRGPIRRAAARFHRDRVAMASLVWIALVAAVAVVGLFWTPHPPTEQYVGDLLEGPGSGTWLGTDDLGRDVLSRLMRGASVALSVSLFVVGGAILIAVPIGLFAGYRGGYVDVVTMRVMDALTSVPGLVAALAVVGMLGPGLRNISIALMFVLVPSYVRLVRSQALSVSAESYVAASRSVGSSTMWILVMRVLPGVLPALAVQASLGLGSALTAEAALSFLGLGVTPPDPSWGSDLARAYRNMLEHPAGIAAPMIAISTVVLAFNLVGDGLRDAIGGRSVRRLRRHGRLGVTLVSRLKGAGSAAPPLADPTVRLAVDGLCVDLETEDGTKLSALDEISLEVRPGEVLGIVGESGSGKTLTAMSITRLLSSPPGRITGGSIRFEDKDILAMSLRELREVRGGGIGMVFQNPMTSLDPVYTVGASLREAIQNHERMSRRQADERAIELLRMVGIPSPERRIKDYPSSFSGGMRQRVMLAMALAGRPSLLIADEPTTALDVTIQAQILELLASLRDEMDMAIILVTHDLGVVADICDRVAVVYAGHLVESAPAPELFANPAHPYTGALLDAVPSLDASRGRLQTIPGSVPTLSAMPDGCRFAPRCSAATDRCRSEVPKPEWFGPREVRCFHPLTDLVASP